jgi:hypothetical protein
MQRSRRVIQVPGMMLAVAVICELGPTATAKYQFG